MLATCHISIMASCQHEAIMTDRKPMQLRLPPDLKAWVQAQADKNLSSQNSEVIRAVRERMDRTTQDHQTA
jgi:Arc/MetJ-type ribon-helix-helix transcriptional regulator